MKEYDIEVSNATREQAEITGADPERLQYAMNLFAPVEDCKDRWREYHRGSGVPVLVHENSRCLYSIVNLLHSCQPPHQTGGTVPATRVTGCE